MLLSHSHRFLFVHTIRTGGTSVVRALEPYVHRAPEGTWNRYLSKTGLVRDPHKVRLREHETALGAQRILPREVFDEYFKFAFVRNPWSWLVSVWMRLRTTESHRHFRTVSKLTFPEYVAFEVERNKRHQHTFVCDREGELLVDFVGRQESLAADFADVCRRLKIEGVALPHVGGRKRDHSDYRTYYDDALRDRVAEHWSKDVKLFRYAFDPSATPLTPLVR